MIKRLCENLNFVAKAFKAFQENIEQAERTSRALEECVMAKAASGGNEHCSLSRRKSDHSVQQIGAGL